MKAFRNSKRTTPHLKYDLEKQQDDKFRVGYVVETKNRFTALLEDWRVNERMPDDMWEEMSRIYTESADKTLGKKKAKPSKPYISEEVFLLAQQSL